jgi:hypothetical protein
MEGEDMRDLCSELFGARWAELDVPAIEAFLADASQEGVRWAVLGPDASGEEVSRHVCAFANSEDGGVLLFGVARSDDEGWTVPGLAFPREALALWIDAVVEAGVRPRPDYALRALPAGDDRWLGAVRIAPLAETPCATRDDSVYERVSGRVVPVVEPARLAALYERGELARRAAATAAEGLARELVAVVAEDENGPRAALALRTTWVVDDAEARIFGRVFEDALAHAATAHLHARADPALRHHQARVVAWVEAAGSGAPETTGEWAVHVLRDGTVGVAYSEGTTDLTLSAFIAHVVQPGWRLAADLVDELEGGGSGFMSLAIAPGEGIVDGPSERFVHLARRAPAGYPGRTELSGVRRELARAGGRRVHEQVGVGAHQVPRPRAWRAPGAPRERSRAVADARE